LLTVSTIFSSVLSLKKAEQMALVVLTKNQLVMSYRIALASGKKGTPRDLVGEVLGVIGGGFLFRQGARQLVGLIPVAGIVPKVAVAYAGTLAIGKAVVTWAAYGTTLEPGAIKNSVHPGIQWVTG
jgi:uncharacterized protein (DUF697 family)